METHLDSALCRTKRTKSPKQHEEARKQITLCIVQIVLGIILNHNESLYGQWNYLKYTSLREKKDIFNATDQKIEWPHRELSPESAALLSYVMSFSSLFSCPAHNFTVLVHSHCFYSVIFRRSRQMSFAKKALTTLCTLPAQHQTADRQLETSCWT